MWPAGCTLTSWPRFPSCFVLDLACTWFECVSMLVILLNCVTLGMYQPCDDMDCLSDRCKILQVRPAPTPRPRPAHAPPTITRPAPALPHAPPIRPRPPRPTTSSRPAEPSPLLACWLLVLFLTPSLSYPFPSHPLSLSSLPVFLEASALVQAAFFSHHQLPPRLPTSHLPLVKHK